MTSLGLGAKISFTAPTGIAACNIQGLTIHSWSGIGMGNEDIEKLLDFIMKNKNALNRWRTTEILVIDEISMLSDTIFDKLDIIGRRIRGNSEPFGGLQLILCGDFFQLPPVGIGKNCKFCFQSNAWKEIFEGNSDNLIELDKVFRQKDDVIFLNILNEMRVGNLSVKSSEILAKKALESSSKSYSSTDIIPTNLFPKNDKVDNFNTEQLNKLTETDVAFVAIDEGKEPYLTQLRNGMKAPKELFLKVGAQVMLTKNLSTADGLVNGARGIIIGFEKSGGKSFFSQLPIVKFSIILGSEKKEELITLIHDTWEIKQGDKVIASRIQIPLVLAWGISIHKSQGMTISHLEVSFRDIFEYGQAYVGLSRATSLNGLNLKDFRPSVIKAHPLVIEFYKRLKQQKIQVCSDVGSDDTIKITMRYFNEMFIKDKSIVSSKSQDPGGWIEAKPRETKPYVQPFENATIEDTDLVKKYSFKEFNFDGALDNEKSDNESNKKPTMKKKNIIYNTYDVNSSTSSKPPLELNPYLNLYNSNSISNIDFTKTDFDELEQFNQENLLPNVNKKFSPFISPCKSDSIDVKSIDLKENSENKLNSPKSTANSATYSVDPIYPSVQVNLMNLTSKSVYTNINIESFTNISSNPNIHSSSNNSPTNFSPPSNSNFPPSYLPNQSISSNIMNPQKTSSPTSNFNYQKSNSSQSLTNPNNLTYPPQNSSNFNQTNIGSNISLSSPPSTTFYTDSKSSSSTNSPTPVNQTQMNPELLK